MVETNETQRPRHYLLARSWVARTLGLIGIGVFMVLSVRFPQDNNTAWVPILTEATVVGHLSQ